MTDFFEYIDDYKNGSLQGETLDLFLKALEEDDSLKKAVNNYETATALSKGLLEMDMIETLKGLDQQRLKETENHSNTTQYHNYKSTLSTRLNEKSYRSVNSQNRSLNITDLKITKIFKLRTLLLVASTIGVIFIGGWWLLSGNDRLDKEYTLANYTTPIDEDATKSIDTIGMSSFEKGKYFFALNRFEESEDWLKSFLSESKSQDQISQGYFWLGAAHIEQWEVEEARLAWTKSNEPSAIENLKIISSR